jgi:hypothetical protein
MPKDNDNHLMKFRYIMSCISCLQVISKYLLQIKLLEQLSNMWIYMLIDAFLNRCKTNELARRPNKVSL